MPAYKYLVSRIAPAKGEVDVPVNTDIEISFNHFMQTDRFIPENIRITDTEGESIPWKYIDYIHEKKLLIIKPVDSLEPHSEYTIIIVGGFYGVRSIATHYYLPEDERSGFTTGEAVVDEGDGSVEDPGDGLPSQPDPGDEAPETGNPVDIFSFGIRETYPVDGAVHITPEKVIILFDSELDSTTVSNESVYIVRAKGKTKMSVLDLMTAYSHEKGMTVDSMTVDSNTIVIEAEFMDNAEYTVVVRSSVKSKSGNELGQNISWSFMTKFPYLYGDAELIRNDINVFLSGVTDRILYKMMRDNSEYAYEIATAAGTMPATDAEGAPMHVHQYVRYKTAYDLLLNGQIRESTSSGNSISLGDLSVNKDSGSSSMVSASKDFRNQIKIWEDAIRGYNNRGYARTRSVVKGENVSTYPEFLTRAEYRELGQ